MELVIKSLDTTQLRLVRFDFDMSQSEIVDSLFEVMSREEQLWVYKMMLTVPNDSSAYPDEDVWDIFLTDDELMENVLFLFKKYNIEYNVVDISDNYYRKDILISEHLSESVDLYLQRNLTIDMVLDRINQVGLCGINVFERSFLEKYKSE